MHSINARCPAPTVADRRSCTDQQDHLRDEMAWLTLLLKQVLLASVRPGGSLGPCDEFAGMYVSEDEVRRFLADDSPDLDPSDPDNLDLAADLLAERTRAARTELERRAADLRESGSELRLPQLAQRFALSATEIRLLAFCLAPDVDVRFHRLFAYLQNDVSKRRPCIQFLSRLCEGLRDVVDTRLLLSPDAPLLRHRLLVLPSRATGEIPIPLQQPVVAPAVIDFLFGRDRIDERLAAFGELLEPRPMPDYGGYSRHHRAIIDRLVPRFRAGSDGPLVYIGAAPGSQRGGMVEQIASESGRRVVRVRAAGLAAATESVAELLEWLARDVTLHGALLHLQDIDQVLLREGAPTASALALQTWLGQRPPVPTLLTGSRPPAELSPVIGASFAGFEIPPPNLEERSEIWSCLLARSGHETPRMVIDDLAAKFRFTPGQIEAVIRAAAPAAVEASGREPLPILRPEDLHRCSREASNQRLLAFARKLSPRYTWKDIALPSETAGQLREICGLVRHRRQVYGRWGFETKFSVGNGVNALFAGPSGTGKTMSAEIIAGDLGLDIYKLDLSNVVSKYVGETERNLDRIFTEAETSNCILFFDEADALFGKRSEVKDAHDRYANIEINYLLQKLDDYRGIIVLATNFKGNLDAAFTRRLNYVVEFPAPDAELRRAIWAGVFPDSVPRAADIDLEFMARRFEFSGGNIKNVALNAAFMAAAAGGPVHMHHLIRATKREFQKLGRLCSKTEFGPYLGLARAEPET